MPGDDADTLNITEPDSLLTTKEVAELLGIHQNTVRRWSDLGLFRSFRVSRRSDRRYRYEDISSYIITKDKKSAR